MVQWVQDPELSLLRLGSLLWCGFDPWPGNALMLQVQPKGKGKELWKLQDGYWRFITAALYFCI